MFNKKFCMSSYLAYRYIEREDINFADTLIHQNIAKIPDCEKTIVYTAKDIDESIQQIFDNLKTEKLGIFLSGGMDSAILAAYMSGCDAYTFRFMNGEFQKEELERAEYYAKTYNLNLHYVDIDWCTVEGYLDACMVAKNAPVHSIEPQLLQGALQAKKDGITKMVIGESSDLVFGGMDKLLAKDWTIEEFQQRYTFTNPEEVLKEPIDVSYLFERYRNGEKIDFLSFMNDVFSIESSSSYWNALTVAGMKYVDPYAKLKMGDDLDLERVRNGESKYLIRELFKMKYPEYPVPEKVPMPRPVDEYFKNWEGPRRKEFIENLNISKFTGNQKWQIYCLERFLNYFEL